MYLAPVNFGAWQPLEDAPRVAPPLPGVLQARSEALIAYPKGRSAMVYYAHAPAGETLRAWLTASDRLAVAATRGARWVRFAEAADPVAAFDRVLRQFTERFGAPPLANQPPGSG